VRYILLLAVAAVMIWLATLLWQMMVGTGNVG
jgi:hypothetical protein